MKKMMRTLTAALLVLCCVPTAALTASAIETPWYWGDTTWDVFEGETPINSYGWGGENALVFVGENNAGGVTVVTPRENTLRFVLREHSDAAADAMVAVMETYFPDIKASLNEQTFAVTHERRYNTDWSSGDWELFELTWGVSEEKLGRVYELSFRTMPDNAAELETNILRDLARAHLISEFYGWGGTASYQTGYLMTQPLSGFLEQYYTYDDTGNLIEASVDWDGVQTYLDEHHPGCTVVQYEDEKGELYAKGTILYRIHTSDVLSFREQIELTCELSETFHIDPNIAFLESMDNSTALGHNALESPGDVTLDCEVDIMDVIAANKQLLGASTLCDTARKNADVNGDGTPDETDSLAILKEVVGLTQGFAE